MPGNQTDPDVYSRYGRLTWLGCLVLVVAIVCLEVIRGGGEEIRAPLTGLALFPEDASCADYGDRLAGFRAMPVRSSLHVYVCETKMEAGRRVVSGLYATPLTGQTDQLVPFYFIYKGESLDAVSIAGDWLWGGPSAVVNDP